MVVEVDDEEVGAAVADDEVGGVAVDEDVDVAEVGAVAMATGTD